jgi:hypothetical protein
MTGSGTLLKQFPNGDTAVDYGNGLVYRTPEAAYTVELDPPGHPLSDEPFGVDLVRTTRSEYGLERVQRLPLAEYRSYMAAAEHVREVEDQLLTAGREGLAAEMALVDTMPFEPDSAVYIVGLYPSDPDDERGTLNIIRLEEKQVTSATVARGSISALTPIEQRLLDVQAEGDVDVFLKAATAEAIRGGEIAPGTPLFAYEGRETDLTSPAWEDHPDWPDLSAWDQPPAPLPAAQMLPVTFGDDLTPFDRRGRYVPHHRDQAGTAHFFAVVERPSDSLFPDETSHELRYFRARQTDEGLVVHDSLPVLPVSDPETSPWPLPALHLYLEDGDLDIAQSLARQVARDNDLPFPHRLPALDSSEPPRESDPGWVHFDAALVSATPQGVDDGYSVGVVDVYANHTNGKWAARYLPMGEFDTLDEALAYQQQTLFNRIAEDRVSALSPAGFNDSPAIYERIALAEADAALTDLLEQNDGHYPPDYDGGHELGWEALSSKEWHGYRDHVRTVTDAIPGAGAIWASLATATPQLADDALVIASIQPDAPYQQAEDFKTPPSAPTWRLDIVPARDSDGAPLGYSAVCVVDFSDLAETLSPDRPERGQWLEVAQFQTEERANQFRDDFMALVESDESGHVTGPLLAGVVADDLEMDSQWQIMDQPALDRLKANEWAVVHAPTEWQPRLDGPSPTQAVSAAGVDLHL